MTLLKHARHLVENLDQDRLSALRGSSMLLTADHTTADLETLCLLAEVFEAVDRAKVKCPLFACELNYAIFFDNSTRTKSAWSGAAARFGAHPVIVEGGSTQIAHGETAEETGAMLGMNAHALGVRHDKILGEGNTFMVALKKGIDDYLATTKDDRVVPIVNLQCDVDHPTQSIADLLWLRERFPQGLRDRTITVSWAYSPSYAKPLSVPQGLITLLTRFGAQVRLAHPPGYRLLDQCVDQARDFANASGGSFTCHEDMDEAFEGADVVYPKSWGPHDLMFQRVAANKAADTEQMRRIEEQCLAMNAKHKSWICDERRMAMTAAGKALYMHCLPADIGDEVSPRVMDGARVDLARQANKKVYGIMAMLAAAKAPRLEALLSDLLR